MRKLYQLGPIFRISVAIIGLIMALILVFDSFFDLLPSKLYQQVEIRKQISFAISDQIVRAVASNDQQLPRLLDQFMLRNPSLKSIGVRQEGRGLIAASKGHVEEWGDAPRKLSTPTHMSVPLVINGSRWGEAEFRFRDVESIKEWISQPTIKFIILFSTFGLLSIYFYLRKVLHHLDPSNAVPQRVKKAFDNLAEGVVLIGPKNHILLANASFHEMNAGGLDQIEGKSILRLDWLLHGLTGVNNLNESSNIGNASGSAQSHSYPWDTALQLNQAVPPQKIKVTLPNGRSRELIMNCGPIDDGTGVARGCLTTFDDVTELSEANRKLEFALQELQISRDKIEEQNIELQKHASLDPLTGCINRRSFFAQAEPIFQSAMENNTEVHCIMSDIDHFKAFNDKYGHSVGDAVIQQVANAMRRSLRSGDLLCRYGGEEFCILLSGNEVPGPEVAERMRDTIERESGPGVRTIEGLRITSSFGVAIYSAQNMPQTLAELIDQADKSLYDAKHAGRNRVSVHAPEQASSNV